MTPLLNLRNVSKTFGAGDSAVRAVNEADLSVAAGSTHGLIGESGSGKSTLGRLALGLLPADEGSVEFDGVDLTRLSPRELRAVRGRLTVVFQEPFESLNPRMRVGAIVAEPLMLHDRGLTRSERDRIVRETFELVQLDQSMTNRYPGELSGGQQQRIGIARAIVTRPSLVVLDEPTSSLDVSVRARIIRLLQELQGELQLSYLFISHDISTVRYVSEEISVMLLGRIIERAPASELFAHPKHPYTLALMSAELSPRPSTRTERIRLRPTGISAPSGGCALAGRCPRAQEVCVERDPSLDAIAPNHSVACHFPEGDVHLPETVELRERPPHHVRSE